MHCVPFARCRVGAPETLVCGVTPPWDVSTVIARFPLPTPHSHYSQHMPSLHCLGLENTGLGDKGVRAVCKGILGATALSKLLLRRNRIGALGAHALALTIAGESADTAKMVRATKSEEEQKKDIEALRAKSAVVAAVSGTVPVGPRAKAAAAAALEAENARLAAIAAQPKVQVG
jgi:hypothetical protein